MATDNPYLAHYNKSEKSRKNGSKANGDYSGADPLFGFIPRKVKAPAVEKALVHLTTNARGSIAKDLIER